MMAITPQLMKRAHLIARISSHIGIYKSLPDIIHCHLRGVHHILRIETVIAQLVEHNFVGWKITSTTSTTSPTNLQRHETINGLQQDGFTELVFVDGE